MQCDHLSKKPGNVREFETCQGKNLVREVSQNCSLLSLVECLCSTSFFSARRLVHCALEVNFNNMRYINLHFTYLLTLLTYLLPYF